MSKLKDQLEYIKTENPHYDEEVLKTLFDNVTATECFKVSKKMDSEYVAADINHMILKAAYCGNTHIHIPISELNRFYRLVKSHVQLHHIRKNLMVNGFKVGFYKSESTNEECMYIEWDQR